MAAGGSHWTQCNENVGKIRSNPAATVTLPQAWLNPFPRIVGTGPAREPFGVPGIYQSGIKHAHA